MSPQEWLAAVYADVWTAPPLPAGWSVKLPYKVVSTPLPYWYVVANHVLSFNHALKRYYATYMIEHMARVERELFGLFEDMPNGDGKYTGREYTFDVA